MTTQTTSNRLLTLNDSLPESIRNCFDFDENVIEFIVSENRHTDSNRDSENGLYYFNHRFYDPETKRFLSKDPAAIDVNDPRTINRFTFVNNNPLRFVDPDGRFSFANMFNKIWTMDFGKTPEASLNMTLDETSMALNKGASLVGDSLQGISDPMLSGGAFIGGTAALITAPAWAPVATAGAVGAGIFTGLSLAKTGINAYRGDATALELGLEIGSEGIGAIPIIGRPASILFDGGQFMYDTIKWNYNNPQSF